MKTYNKITHIWSMLCQESSVDSNTNNLSLFKILEQVQFNIDMNELDKMKVDPSKAIAFPFKFNLVTLWAREENKDDQSFLSRILLKDPNGKKLMSEDKEITFTDGKKRLRSITVFNVFPVTDSGEYTCSVFIKDGNEFKEVSVLPLDIKVNLIR